jgi:hypothetical protein
MCILILEDFIWNLGISPGSRFMAIQKCWKINCPISQKHPSTMNDG